MLEPLDAELRAWLAASAQVTVHGQSRRPQGVGLLLVPLCTVGSRLSKGCTLLNGSRVKTQQLTQGMFRRRSLLAAGDK